MTQNSAWIGKYVVVIIVALVLGVTLGELALFKSTTLGSPKFTAARLAQFLSHAAALGLLWMVGWQIAEQMRQAGGRQNSVATILLAFITLLVTAIGYVVLSHFIDPFTSKGVKDVVKWVFVTGVFAAGTWFILVLFAGGEDLISCVRDGLNGKKQPVRQQTAD